MKNTSLPLNWPLFFFLIILSIFLTINELFQAPQIQKEKLTHSISLIANHQREEWKEVELENKHIKIKFYKTGTLWSSNLLTGLPIKQSAVNNILQIITQLKVQVIYEKDIINKENFLLNKPKIKIQLKDTKNHSFMVGLGLPRPTNNSIYTLLNNNDHIYQVGPFEGGLRSIKLASFIDNNIISLKKDTLLKITLYKVLNNGHQKNILSLERKKQKWNDTKKVFSNIVNQEKYIDELLNIKGVIIIENNNALIKQQMKSLLSRPSYILSFQGINHSSKYIISKVFKTLPGLNLSGENVLIKSRKGKITYLISKKLLDFIKRSDSSIFKTPIPIKKLFYQGL